MRGQANTCTCASTMDWFESCRLLLCRWHCIVVSTLGIHAPGSVVQEGGDLSLVMLLHLLSAMITHSSLELM